MDRVWGWDAVQSAASLGSTNDITCMHIDTAQCVLIGCVVYNKKVVVHTFEK